jgi:uncharacterized protein (TIGR00730 family)
MTQLSALCVYCGSSNRGDPRHLDAATTLGRLAAQDGVEIVFGGGHVGLMGALADGALAAGGRVTGIIPQYLEDRELGHRGVTDLVIVESMHARKQKMFELSDAFCVLPGGLGTLDETFEILTWRQIGLHDKPVALVDLDGYWQPLRALMDHQVTSGYLRPEHAELLQVVSGVGQVLPALRAAPAPSVPPAPERL